MAKGISSIKSAKRIVVKVGTSTLTHEDGKLKLREIDRLAMVLCDLANTGKEIVLVSSGAQGVAVGKLGLGKKPDDTVARQAIAAVGQCELMMIYDRMFDGYNRTIAQILLTAEDIENEKRATNTKNTINRLLEMGIIPIINENDTVAFDEIEIGDNDRLSAAAAKLVEADLLILLSDIDGLYDSDPHKNPDAKLLDIVYDISSVRDMADESSTDMGTGGMVTKLDAAEIATENGINMIITNGERIDSIYDILEGKIEGTLFIAKQ